MKMSRSLRVWELGDYHAINFWFHQSNMFVDFLLFLTTWCAGLPKLFFVFLGKPQLWLEDHRGYWLSSGLMLFQVPRAICWSMLTVCGVVIFHPPICGTQIFWWFVDGFPFARDWNTSLWFWIICFMFTSAWGNDPIWRLRIFFKWMLFHRPTRKLMLSPSDTPSICMDSDYEHRTILLGGSSQTCKWLITMVIKSQDLGLWDPFHSWLKYMGVTALTTYKSWDDPPCTTTERSVLAGQVPQSFVSPVIGGSRLVMDQVNVWPFLSPKRWVGRRPPTFEEPVTFHSPSQKKVTSRIAMKSLFSFLDVMMNEVGDVHHVCRWQTAELCTCPCWRLEMGQVFASVTTFWGACEPAHIASMNEFGNVCFWVFFSFACCSIYSL